MSAHASSRRSALATVAPNGSTNAGLWLDAYLSSSAREEKSSRRDLAVEVAGIGEPAGYEAAFARWQQMLRSSGAAPRMATADGRLAIGLGGAGLIETSISLHRTYGVPFIPGSSLKGLAARCAAGRFGDSWSAGSEAHRVVFGDRESAGYVTFYDALPKPKAWSLHLDVMTVHHRDYYGGRNAPPADWDEPNPVPFLTAKGDFLIALAAPPGCEAWVERAYEILATALSEDGVGAKTSSGYGRMRLGEPQRDPEDRKAEEMAKRIASIPIAMLNAQIGQEATKLLASDLDDARKKIVARAIVARVEALTDKKDRKKLREKEWFGRVQALLE